ncbi:hypothetical protein ACFOD9_12135 [Novosphingobium bradum]|uniref:Chemotaxis protein n=1 Tax=Novosphingobium bradum TaxID=1737444 RepID=A0ABV7IRS0_9SPHN
MISENVIWPNRAVAFLFGWEWTGIVLFLAILVWAGAIIWRINRKHRQPFQRALLVRLEATQIIADQQNEGDAQQTFADRFHDINAAMMTDGQESAELRHAWTQFQETIIDPSRTPLEATARPDGYFLHLGDDSRVLAWWANIFVAVGLTATFLGIIAALATAVGAVGGGTTEQMQKGLMGLLTMTATKFWTSIGGVGASILLRWVDRNWHSETEQQLERLCERLEYGTLFSPPQRLAARQLRELEQQSIALTEFSHQLAASIGDALGQHMQPVVAGLSGIQSSLNEFKDGSFDQIGKGLGDAISKSTGIEMQALASALTDMTARLQGVNENLEGTSGKASEQIATAAREFSAASEAMTEAFSTLNGNIGTMADRLGQQAAEADERATNRVREEQDSYKAIAEEQRSAGQAAGAALRQASETATGAMLAAVRDAIGSAMGDSTEAIRTALEGFAGATSGIQSAFDQMQAQVAELGKQLSGSASDAANRNAEVLEAAGRALEAATTRAQAGMGKALDESIARSGEEASRAISAAFAAFGQRFTEASDGLVQTLVTTAGRMEGVAQAIERSTTSADAHAGKLATAGKEAEAVGLMLGRAANDVSGAAGPIREAVAAIRESVGQSGELLRRAEESGLRQNEALASAAGTLETMGVAATAAWENYRTRFAEVDKALAEALDKIRGASAEHATALNTEVGRIDKALAEAVERLAPALDVLKDLADAMEDQRRKFEPAE